MKRTMVTTVLILLTAPVFAAGCVPAENFKVNGIAYRMRSAEASLQHLLLKTPYKGVMGVSPKSMIKVRRIAGPLSQSLDAMAAQTNTSWRQEGCRIIFSGNAAKMPTAVPVAVAPTVTSVVAGEHPAKAPTTAWTLSAGVPIHLQFAEWAKRAGWNFEWRLEKSWIVPAATQFSGSFDEALSQAVEGLYAQGKPVRLIIWEGNRFAEIVDVDAK